MTEKQQRDQTSGKKLCTDPKQEIEKNATEAGDDTYQHAENGSSEDAFRPSGKGSVNFWC
ncbi:MAG TPA: hypothetical protein DCR97_02130 [Deltaproteobacteria bacterium]|nr:hypothetical protein [Deltaproteobacteria bacterium]